MTTILTNCRAKTWEYKLVQYMPLHLNKIRRYIFNKLVYLTAYVGKCDIEINSQFTYEHKYEVSEELKTLIGPCPFDIYVGSYKDCEE